MLRILFCFVLLLVFNFCQGQNEFGKNNFFEIGFNIKTPSESNFLKNSDLDENFGNPLVDLIGVQALNRAQEIGVNIKYGHQIFKNFQFISQVGYSRRIEKITCWCHFCEKLSFNNGLKINSIELGGGSRYLLFQKKDFNFSIEGLGFYSITLARDNLNYFNISLNPIVGYNFSETIQANVKLLFQKSFIEYQKNDLLFEIAIQKKM